MANALLSGVSGMSVHQTMINVAGNNLANLNTNGFKSSRVTFADMLSETISEASQPTGSIGGTDPQQIGSGVQLASIDRNMAQGSMVNTGKPLDMAIAGAGYFVVNNGERDLYTRVGTFSVDSAFHLVEAGSGYRVQRIGTTGEADGFQDIANDAIRIPYEQTLPARATTAVSYNGQLAASVATAGPTTNVLASGIEYTTGGSMASEDTTFADLDQASSFVGTIEINGYEPDGTPITEGTLAVTGATKMSDLIAAINTAFTGAGVTARLGNGQIYLKDTAAGYSQADISLTVAAGATGTMDLPNFFNLLTPGGEAVRNTNIEIYDPQGLGHTLSAAFVKTNLGDWDLVVTSLTGDVTVLDRRIEGITFMSDGSYGGLDATINDTATITIGYGLDDYSARTLTVGLGTVGAFDGVSQSGDSSNAAPSSQDGYGAGVLSSLAVSGEGVLVGVFTNGIRKDLATIQLATFCNLEGLASVGGNFYEATVNSGEPVPTQGESGGAGSVTGGQLEGSNVDVANEFVNLIQAQNGYQANARTIKVVNDMLSELTNLIR